VDQSQLSRVQFDLEIDIVVFDLELCGLHLWSRLNLPIRTRRSKSQEVTPQNSGDDITQHQHKYTINICQSKSMLERHYQDPRR
jgi:hypothetical protein